MEQTISAIHMTILRLIDQEAEFYKEYAHLSLEELLDMGSAKESEADIQELAYLCIQRRQSMHPQDCQPDSDVEAGGFKFLNYGPPVKVGDVIVAVAPSAREIAHWLQTSEYEVARARERLERLILQNEPIVSGNTHAFTKRKQPMLVNQARRVTRIRSNTQKRQLYGAPVKRK